MDINSLLRRQAIQELQVCAQIAFLSVLVDDASIQANLASLADDELGHFREVCAVATDLGVELDLSEVNLGLISDPTAALIHLEAQENTLRHYLSDLLGVLDEPHRSMIKHQVEREAEHERELRLLRERLTQTSGPSVGTRE